MTNPLRAQMLMQCTSCVLEYGPVKGPQLFVRAILALDAPRREDLITELVCELALLVAASY